MKPALAFSFLVLGVTSLVAQVILLRELMSVFYGNEFFIGWTLFAWLLWVSLGSLGAGRLLRGGASAVGALIADHAMVALLVPAAVALIRVSRLAIGTVPGAVPDLVPSLGYALLALAPLCAALGVQFVAGVKAWTSQPEGGGLGRAAGEAYVFETAGFVAGGICFSYLLVAANEFAVAPLLTGLNVIAAGTLHGARRRRPVLVRVALALLFAGAVVTFAASPRLNRRTAEWRFPGQRLVETRNTIHGNLAVAQLGGQHNFYQNGLLLGADREQMAAENIAHFPMLYHPNPKHVLLIGGGFSGVLAEILKHAPERVNYVELDPRLVETARRYLAPDLLEALDDPRVHTLFVDGRFYLKQLAIKSDAAPYDVVIVNLPNPSTVLINRFFSREFFRQVRAHLAPDGILATQLSFSPDYLSPELEDLGASVYKTLAGEFASVVILPEYTMAMIASPAAGLTHDAEPLIRRMGQRRVATDFVVPKYIEYRLTTDRIDQAKKAFRANTSARVNRDEWPVACYYNLLYWISSFHPQTARAAARLSGVTWKSAAAVAAVALAVALLLPAKRAAAALPALAKGAGSLSLMAIEVLILLSFQVLYGYVYHKVALILAALMLGMAAGALAGNRALDRAGRGTLAAVHALVIVYAGGYYLLNRTLAAASLPPGRVVETVFLLLASVIGALAGFEFPVANKLYLDSRGDDHRRAGVIYAVDLLGSCLGALLFGMWLLPVMGLGQALLALAMLNGVVVAAWAKARRQQV